jgi:hypothetical protein
MYDGLEPNKWQARKLQDWLLAIVRFAITLDTADRQTVLAIAQEMDGLGSLPGRSSFSYFVRTGTDLCRAIADRDDPGRITIIRRHLAAIGDRRLRQTAAAAFDLEGARQARLSEARCAGRNGRSQAAAVLGQTENDVSRSGRHG